jgi:hypothetical protein
MDFSLKLADDVLRRTPDVLRAALSGLDEEWTQASESPDAWSPYQVVGHLVHIEETDWIDRTRVILEHGPDHVFEPVDREAGFSRFAGGRSRICSTGLPSCARTTSRRWPRW